MSKQPNTLAELGQVRGNESIGVFMDAKPKLQSDKLSDRDRGSLEQTVESNERRIGEAAFELDWVDGLPD